MKHLQSWLKFLESADSPELVGKFSPEEIKKLTRTDSPYKSDYRKFQHNFYSGAPASGDLIQYLNDAEEKGNGSMYGISDYLLQELRKAVPDFKDFTFGKYENMYSNFHDGKLGLHLEKEIKLQGTRFNAEAEIWIYYHTKGNKWFDYKKGKIYVLFTCGLRPTEKSFDLMGGIKKESTPEDDIVRKSFSDMIITKPSSCPDCEGDEVGMDDKGFDKFSNNLDNILYGHPDDEDKNLHNRLQISHKNLTITSFLKTLPKIKENLDYFKKYILNKYNLEF